MKGLNIAVLGVSVAFGLLSCNAPATGRDEIGASETSEVLVEVDEPLPPLADGFDFPVGPPDAEGYYDAQSFQKNNHLGSDWNGTGGGNSDLGDPVFAMSNGLVLVAKDYQYGWGNVVRVVHNIGTTDQPRLIESLYAHLDSIHVEVGDTLRGGEQLGTIGNADGVYLAHLHFEVRDSVDMPLGGGYSAETDGFLDPTAFIKDMRKRRGL